MTLFGDQDLYRRTVEFLREEGHDVITAAEVGLAKPPDPIILAHARRHARILVTRDKGYGALVHLGQAEPHGLILLRGDPRSLDAIHVTLARLLREQPEAVLARSVAVIEADKYRLRPLPRPRK